LSFEQFEQSAQLTLHIARAQNGTCHFLQVPFMTKRNTIAKIGNVVAFGEAGGDCLLTVAETAEFLRCSVSSLNKWRVSGRGPRFVRIGTRVRYRATDVAAFIERETRASTSEITPT
jgi:excisionase family DNA binding protein